MNEFTTKSSLSDAKRQLVELMQQLNFGRIEDLTIRRGDPDFGSLPKLIQKIKIGGENGPRPEFLQNDFVLKRQTLEMLDALIDVGDGKVLAIEVKHGLPFSMEVELTHAKALTEVGRG